MSISAADVGKLRQMTGVGMMEAKKALEEVGGDFDKAIEELRKRGAAKAAKKADRETSEGRVHTYTHTTGKIGVMVKVVCETDFVAKNDDFVAFCNDLAMHAAAMAPDYLKREDVPEDVVAKEREILAEQLKAEGKPEDMLDKILVGKLDKFYSEICFLEQKFIKDDSKSIAEYIESKVLSLGENIQLVDYVRMQIG